MSEIPIFSLKKMAAPAKNMCGHRYSLFTISLLYYLYRGAVSLADDVQALLQVGLSYALHVVDG